MKQSNNATVDEERNARLAVILKAADDAGIPREMILCRDCTAHEVSIPSSVFVALTKFVDDVREASGHIEGLEGPAMLKEAIAMEKGARSGVLNVEA